MKPLIFFKIDIKNPKPLNECENFFSKEFSVDNSKNFIFFEKKIFFSQKK